MDPEETESATRVESCSADARGQFKGVSSVAFSPDGKLILSKSHDGTVLFWCIPKRAALWTLYDYPYKASSVTFLPDGKFVMSRSHDRTVQLWGAAMGAMPQMLEGQMVHTLYLSNDWVAEKGGDVLWLPADYRATCIIVWNGIVVLGHSLGRISFFEFKEDLKFI